VKFNKIIKPDNMIKIDNYKKNSWQTLRINIELKFVQEIYKMWKLKTIVGGWVGG
jgi:hypothetical protein